MRKLLEVMALLALASCAAMPEGRHGERLRISHGWLDVSQVTQQCVWQQRVYAFRVSCTV